MTKKNLNWKINYLAAQVGEESHIQQAKTAATRLHYKHKQSSVAEMDEGALKQELSNTRKEKLTSKLFHARKVLKAAIKKSQRSETMKQYKRLKKAPEDTRPRLEKELEITKSIDCGALAKKALYNKIRKQASLKNQDIVLSVLDEEESSTLNDAETTDEDTKHLGNVEARILAHQPVHQDMDNIITELESIVLGLAKKKKSDELHPPSEVPSVRANDSDDMFVESLQDLGNQDMQENKVAKSKRLRESTDWEDPDFDKYYGNEAKKNRPGQRARRRIWEQLYGEKANHIRKETRPRKQFGSHDEKRHLSKDRRSPGSRPTLPSHPPDDELHPSWIAKRQQQELMAKALSKNAASNNKIVFDTDD